MTGFDISKMSQGDIDFAVRLGKQMHECSNFRSISFSTQKVRTTLEHSIDRPDHLLLVLSSGGVRIGAFWAVLQKFYFSDELLANDMAFFVDRNFVGKISIRRVIRKYIYWAKTNGATRINISQSTGMDVEKTRSSFEKLGFAYAGGNFTLIDGSNTVTAMHEASVR